MFQRILSVIAALCAAMLLTTAAMAQQPAQSWNGPHFFPQEAPDDAVTQVMQVITSRLDEAHGSDGNPLPPLTAEERAAPLLDVALVKEIMDVGAASGIGQVCALDWQNQNYLRLMARERARGDRTEHQLAAIALVHGFVQGEIMHEAPACSDALRQAATTFYAAKWGAETH